MTEAEKLAVLRIMCGGVPADGDWSDEVLTAHLTLAGRKIIDRAYPFDAGVTEVPERYGQLQCEIACYMLNRRGSEGQTSHSENGISRAYESSGVPESMLEAVTPMCGVPS